MVATQAHPEFKSRPTRPHPLFASFVRAALDYLESERLPILGTDRDGEPADPGSEADPDPAGALVAG
jgi:CTP synthase